jgi:hypothetical protein
MTRTHVALSSTDVTLLLRRYPTPTSGSTSAISAPRPHVAAGADSSLFFLAVVHCGSGVASGTPPFAEAPPSKSIAPSMSLSIPSWQAGLSMSLSALEQPGSLG